MACPGRQAPSPLPRAEGGRLAAPNGRVKLRMLGYIPLNPPFQRRTFAIDWRRVTFTKLMSNHKACLAIDNSQIPLEWG